MKIQIVLFFLCVTLISGCAAATYNTIPAGKTDADWGTDEAYCLKKSGRITGFLASTPIGLAINAGGANQKNEQCLKDLGWIK